jgi:surfeit locus 1 family protein
MVAAFRRRDILGLAVAAAAGFAVLVSLGVWQLQRQQWKQALIARVEERLVAPPVPAPGPEAWSDLDLGFEEYRPVSVSGRFRNADEVHVVATLTAPKGPLGGIGYLVMTPLQTSAGWIVYVNRGFVPAARKDSATRAAGLVETETVVTGLLRAPYRRSWFMPKDRVDRNEWFSRDPRLYAEATGLRAEDVAPFIIDASRDSTAEGGLPQGGETIVSFPDNHLGYALTWFGLAAGLAGVFVVFARRQFTRSDIADERLSRPE